VSKNIILCCDGTTNEIATESTNVLRFYRCLVRNDSLIVYYDCGVGVISNTDRISQRGRRLSRTLDSAMGHSIREHVVEAYRFLVKYYEPGDQIYLVGFSRGPYAARGIAGMIYFLGLLRPELEHLAEMAWSVYSGENIDHTISMRFQGGNRFKKCFCINEKVMIHFVGVWDTVSSFGWINDLRTLPHTANNSQIKHIRHAVAIDEHRAMFRVNHFRPESNHQHETIKEVWFSGCHCDVGGGYPEVTGALSKISLEWMLREGESCGL
tara:strand:+ start:14908 stop:15708 length:801 start_codon:yes stop_codon:yes gene_type:complete